MTGTGTQSDPYVPVTLTEFIEAVGTSGAYVALDRDIDAAEDPAYTGELTEAIAINAVSVQCGDFSLIGVTFNSVYGFTIASGSYIYDLTLRNIAGKATVAGAFFVGSGSSRCGLRGCSMSLKLDGGTQYIAYDTDFSECAIDVIDTSGASTTIFSGCSFNRTTIVITGAMLDFNAAVNVSTFSRSALIFRDVKAVGNAVFSYNSSLTYSYVCFADAVVGTIQVGSPSGTVYIVATTDDQTVTAPSSAIRATLAQLKDETWLASVGFLP